MRHGLHDVAGFRVEIDFDFLAGLVFSVKFVAVARHFKDLDRIALLDQAFFESFFGDPLALGMGRALSPGPGLR